MKFLKYLPIGSFFDFVSKNKKLNTENFLKGGFHTLYGLVGGGFLYMAVVLYGSTILIGGSKNFNPINSVKEIKHRRQMNQEYMIQTNRYNELTDKIFGRNGLADVNKDGRINPIEKIEACRLLGIPEDSIEIRCLTKPTSEDLERAVKNYELK